MLTVWGKNQQETELTCVAKGKDMCWYPLDKVVALTKPFGIFRLFLLAAYCIYVCIGRYFTLKNKRNLHL